MPGPDLNPYGVNAAGVQVKPLDYTHPLTPSLKVYHGLGIAVNGALIGRITSWQPTNAYNRKVNAVYELSPYTFGQPVDLVPAGAEAEYTIDVTRGEIWNQEFEKVLGFPATWECLSDQNRPFTLQEYWFRGNEPYEIFHYVGCWFNAKNFAEAFTADGDGKVNITGTVAYIRRQRVF